MKVLLEEYQESLQLTKKMRENAAEEDQKIYGNMVGSLEFIKKWLETGQMPVRSKELGSYPSEAFLNFEEEWGGSCEDPYSRNAFEEAEDRIDAEIRRNKRG